MQLDWSLTINDEKANKAFMSELRDRARVLNQSCQCITLDEAELDAALRKAGAELGLAQLADSHPNLFSRSAVFADPRELLLMESVVRAVERVVALPAYRERALTSAKAPARIPTRTRGAVLGFDFHLADQGPQLIEINTNPGGGLLNSLLRSAQRACCEPIARAFGTRAPVHTFVETFEEEWRLARGSQTLAQLAIVDDEPERQFLYPEFVLFRAMCEARGYRALICDARELEIVGDQLRHAGTAIDLVYNRSTDFSLEEPAHGALLEALRRDLAVVTPHPAAYALYADKLRLVDLSSVQTLLSLGAERADAELLTAHVPRTIEVDPDLREQLWSERKTLFFKPRTGYGSKAAYRGDKITRRVFEQVLSEPYVAQALVPPSSRSVQLAEGLRELKLDVRNFAYGGQVQLVCARLYTGQTTNFRSKGGGFAPVYSA